MRALILAGLAASIAGTAPATASSDSAWAAFDVQVTRACLAASHIRAARHSAIVGFDDRIGMVAMLVRDGAPGSTAAKLCLYDKLSRKAYVDEAEGWSAPLRTR